MKDRLKDHLEGWQFCENCGMQALGVDIQTIQSIVGHADTEMTEHYLHVQESIRQSESILATQMPCRSCRSGA